MVAGVYNQFRLVETMQTFNLTINFDEIELTGASVRSGAPIYRRYGLIIAADSPTFVYGVKSDVGTTDGFLVLPITKNSTEFMIAGWRYEDVRVLLVVNISNNRKVQHGYVRFRSNGLDTDRTRTRDGQPRTGPFSVRTCRALSNGQPTDRSIGPCPTDANRETNRSVSGRLDLNRASCINAWHKF
jgi:hypothetical protein